MAKLTYAENPVHPVLNDYPAALIPASLVFDMLHLVTRRKSLRNASFFSLLLALISGGAAAYAGYRDYEQIPDGGEAKRMANAHAVLNVGVLAAVGVSVLMRMFGRVGLFARLLNVATNAMLLVSGWYGTHLVYRHGLRVRSDAAGAAAPPAAGDPGKQYAERLESFAAGFPSTDLRALAGAPVAHDGTDEQGFFTGAEDEDLMETAAMSRTELPGDLGR